MDCDAQNPDWASVTYGCLLCLQCSGKHRSFGVKTSFVRSLTMDEWSYSQVLAMLEGGNQQLKTFFARHQMITEITKEFPNNAIILKRYRTKAARFYRTNLKKHISEVSVAGVYRGREASRRIKNNQQNSGRQQPKKELPSIPVDVTKRLKDVPNASIRRRSVLTRQRALLV